MMSRFTSWRGRAPPRRGFRWRDALLAALVLAGLSGLAVHLMEWEQPVVTGPAVVTDGDSLRIDGVAIRLEGIDTPEIQQTCEAAGETYRCGEVARRELVRLVGGQTLTCRLTGRDRYRRSLARCAVDGEDIGASLVRRGFAVAYGKTYLGEEAAARRDKAGLWAGAFQRPEDWRREHRPPVSGT